MFVAEKRAMYPNAISLAGGMPNPATFPIKSISITYTGDVVKKLVGPDLDACLQYGPAQGYDSKKKPDLISHDTLKLNAN